MGLPLATQLHRQDFIALQCGEQKVSRLIRQGKGSKRRSTIPSSTSPMFFHLSRITLCRLQRRKTSPGAGQRSITVA
jgi:hypothetical protein